MRLLYQSVYQTLCSDFRHLWKPPQVIWTSPPAAVYFCSLVDYTALGVLRDTIPAIPQSFWCRFSFLLSRTQQKTDKMRAEDPSEKIHACSTNSCAKSKRFILQSPTVTPSSMRLWLSIQFIWTMALQIFCRNLNSSSNLLQNIAEQFEGWSSCVMWFSWDVLHSTKSTHVS